MILEIVDTAGTKYWVDPIEKKWSYLGGWINIHSRDVNSFMHYFFDQSIYQVTNLNPCCGGISTVKWDANKASWNCSDCGTTLSNDPSYTSGVSVFIDEDFPVTNNKSKCECGSSSLGSDRHSGYCPLYTEKI